MEKKRSIKKKKKKAWAILNPVAANGIFPRNQPALRYSHTKNPNHDNELVLSDSSYWRGPLIEMHIVISRALIKVASYQRLDKQNYWVCTKKTRKISVLV